VFLVTGLEMTRRGSLLPVFLSHHFSLLLLIVAGVLIPSPATGIRLPDRKSEPPPAQSYPLKIAVFALGSFWRSEAVFGCLNGVVRTTVGYAGGSKPNPEYRSLGDHAESVQVLALSLSISMVHSLMSQISVLIIGN